ncbi:stage II sporulation protein P [Lysinibacillus telephonicus]|uniref:Stage II sporulation protein P n=1 Tax=Lysinibacillus telephonicus TaxID=1714840 RepID=A0A3S0I3V4_9BACI|nr:stage II sporulation protein P [Lysinibacillus telephonicus]RTQ95624.1 stage II sporulation protein P [Lysinibacillus telephonicus]
MLKKIQVLSVFLFFFFMLPIITGLLPFPNNEKYEPPKPEEKQMVYASTEITETEPKATDISPTMDPFDVLFVFTHSHETYKPYAESESGTIAVYDDQANLFTMSKVMEDYFRLNGLNAKTLDVDVMSVMQKKGVTMSAAYDTVRPYISKELKENSYDLILDIHRDATRADKSTIKHKDVKYAKIAFVIGAENPNYKSNLSYANALNQSINKIIPNISRGIIEKKGAGVDGVYNQDLSKNLLLIEIGGIDNTEDEVYRTIAVLAQAISKTFVNDQVANADSQALSPANKTSDS